MASAIVRGLIRRDTDRDSVELMRVAAAVEQLPGVARAALPTAGCSTWAAAPCRPA